MVNFLIAAAILFAIYLGIRTFARTPPAQLARMVKTGAGAAALGLAGLLFLRGRWDFAMAIAGVGLWLMGHAAATQWTRHFPFPAGGGGGPGVSRVRSATLEMELDHDTGALDGEVLAGPLMGRRLSSLPDEEIIALWRDCRGDDPEGARLVEAYLDRRSPGWRAADKGHGDRRGRGGDAAMTEDEAYEVLGLQKDATREDIARAHRGLMKKLHPDHGGTTSLAARVNQAKDVLMRRHG